MYTILEKRVLAENIYLMRIHAPRVARAAKPGQFIIVRIDEFGERVPLTISDYDAEQGSVTIVTQAIGASTRKLCALEQGDALADFVGPLGHPSEFIHEDLDTLRKKRFLFVAGGVGTAPVYPQVKWLHEHGVKADVIIGAKTKSMLIYTEEMARVADNLYIATDDGSEGFKGMVTALIKDLIDNRGKQYDVCVAIGPMIMMKFVTLTTKEYSLPTVVSLNTLMVDGTGMCPMKGIEGNIPMTFIRAPYIKEVWGDAEVLAEVDGKIVAARQGNQLVTAFHPELNESLEIHKYFLGMCSK